MVRKDRLASWTPLSTPASNSFSANANTSAMSALKQSSSYETAWGTFKKSATACPTCPADLKQAHLEEFVYALRDRGVRPVTVNTWLKALNTFFG